MTRDKVDGRSKESDSKDPEMIVVDQNETIDDIEESNTRSAHPDTEVKTKRPGRDKERRFRDSSEEESSTESESEQEHEKPKLSASMLSDMKLENKILVGKSKKKYVSSRTRSPEEKNGKHGGRASEKRPTSNSSASDCESTPVRKSKSIAKKERKDRTKETNKLGRKDGSSRYKGTKSRQKRGRSKDQRLRDSSQSSSSSWSVEKVPLAKKSNKIEVRIELEGGVPVRGYQAKLKQKELDKNAVHVPNKKRARDSSHNSSSSEAHSNPHGNRKTNLDRKLEFRKDDKKKYAKFKNPGLSTFRQKSRSPTQKYKWYSKERNMSASPGSNSEQSDKVYREKKLGDVGRKMTVTELHSKDIGSSKETDIRSDHRIHDKNKPELLKDKAKKKRVSSISCSDDSEVSQKIKSKEKRRELHREKEHGKLRTVKSKTRVQIAGKSYSSENSSSASEYVEESSHRDILSKEVSKKDKQNSSKSYPKSKIRSETLRLENIQVKEDRQRTDSSGSRSSSSERSVDITSAPDTARKDDEVADKTSAPVSVKSEIKMKEHESKSFLEKSDDFPKETVQREKQPGRDHSRSRSRTKSRESSPGGHEFKDLSKPKFVDGPLSPAKSGISVQEEHKLKLDFNEKVDGAKDRKTTITRDSSNSSSSTIAGKRVRSKRSKISSSVKKIARRFLKDRSISKKGSSRGRDSRSKISHKSRELQRRRHKKQDSSESSSSSSSSSRSQSNSSTSSSDSSSSSTSSKSSTKSSLSGNQSSSTSSSSSSSSALKRFKHATKTKERLKNRSRSPLLRRRRSKSPRSKKIHVGRLSRNINKDHLYEIFGLYGTVKNIDLPVDRLHGHMSRGFAYVEFETTEEADRALVHMNGGILDGQKISVAPVLLYKPRPMPVRRMSPIRRPFKPWRPTPPYRNRGGADRRRPLRTPFRRRSPRRRSRSRSNRRRRVRRGSNGSSR